MPYYQKLTLLIILTLSPLVRFNTRMYPQFNYPIDVYNEIMIIQNSHQIFRNASTRMIIFQKKKKRRKQRC